jgi:hypothetical protein
MFCFVGLPVRRVFSWLESRSYHPQCHGCSTVRFDVSLWFHSSCLITAFFWSSKSRVSSAIPLGRAFRPTNYSMYVLHVVDFARYEHLRWPGKSISSAASAGGLRSPRRHIAEPIRCTKASSTKKNAFPKTSPNDKREIPKPSHLPWGKAYSPRRLLHQVQSSPFHYTTLHAQIQANRT